MLKAAKICNTTIQLAGQMESPKLPEQIRAKGLMPYCDYRGFLNRKQVGQLLGSCQIGLLLLQPTEAYQAAMPIKLFEYMLAGLAIVASDFAYWHTLIPDDCAIFVDPASPTEIAHTIHTLLQQPEAMQQMGCRARQYALAHYTYDSERARLLTLYKTLLQEERNWISC